ncbi:hypothetical protein AVEN_275076-1 [Araneus ventricosus]|uniref:Uncharacterized protein n=1 Tax=Araneus ventricosus TaxID=182803 RepID=A0A4Y2RCK2_ARAVE|nr:hypothetical protein AVEN_97104-1 [Araneus ventricosus]GBO29220.1 hypothetical protein AVEN_275076-1 [Araneus ventricosus]
MVPTRRRPSAQGIKFPTVHSGHIPATNHRVWWLLRMASTFTRPEPIGLFLWGYIKQRVFPSTNIAGTSKPYYGCLCRRVTCHVQREVQSRV